MTSNYNLPEAEFFLSWTLETSFYSENLRSSSNFHFQCLNRKVWMKPMIKSTKETVFHSQLEKKMTTRLKVILIEDHSTTPSWTLSKPSQTCKSPGTRFQGKENSLIIQWNDPEDIFFQHDQLFWFFFISSRVEIYELRCTCINDSSTPRFYKFGRCFLFLLRLLSRNLFPRGREHLEVIMTDKIIMAYINEFLPALLAPKIMTFIWLSGKALVKAT